MYVSLLTNGTILDCGDFRTAYCASRAECRSWLHLHEIGCCGAIIYRTNKIYWDYNKFRDDVYAGIVYPVAQFELDRNDGESFRKFH